MKPSSEMLRSAAYAALSASARSALRIVLEEIGAAGGGAVQLSTIFFVQAGMAASAAQSGIRDLVLLGFLRVTGAGTTARSFSLSGGWREIHDEAEAWRRTAEARAARKAKRPARRPRAAPKAPAADAGAESPLPEGVRRARWPQLPWLQGDAS